MRLIRYCAPWFAALSFFAAARSSADVIYQFNGVCDTYYNVVPGSAPEPVSCATLADPSVQLTLTLLDDYPSVGFTVCGVGPPFTCLLDRLTWTDHADASGAEFAIFSFGDSFGCNKIVSGVPPDVFVSVEQLFCGFGLEAGPASFSLSANDTFLPGVDHFVQGTGVWTRIDVPIDEPTSLALTGLASLPLAFVRRRNTSNAEG